MTTRSLAGRLALPWVQLAALGLLLAGCGAGGGGGGAPDGPAPDPQVAPTIVSTPRLTARAGEPYAYDDDGKVEATGSPPPTFSLDPLAPPGLSLDADTGELVWTPGAAGDVTLRVRASNAAGADVQVFTVAVEAAPTPPAITSEPGLLARKGLSYLYDADGTPSATGTPPLVWTLALGPPGMDVDPDTGGVAWIPEEAGSFAVALAVANDLGSDLQEFVVDVAGDPPGVVTPANSTSITYCPPERLALGAPWPEQHLNVFLPTGTPPPTGWPTLLANATGGGFATPPLAEIRADGASSWLYELLAAGVAVVHHGNTGIGNGRGLFYPPGHPSGRYESTAPRDDNPFKEAEWAVQWVKTQTAFPLDPANVCVHGASQGAMILAWATMGEDRAKPAGSEQARASTRVRAVVLLRPPTSMWAMDQTPSLGSRVVGQFERADAPGVPADYLAQVDEELQKAASPLRYLFEPVEARDWNRTQPVCLVYDEPVLHVNGEPAPFALDAGGFPLLHDAVLQPYVHDTWFGYALFQRLLSLGPAAETFHRSSSVFAVRDEVALDPPYDVHTRTFAGPFDGPEARTLVREWVLAALAPPG